MFLCGYDGCEQETDDLLQAISHLIGHLIDAHPRQWTAHLKRMAITQHLKKGRRR